MTFTRTEAGILSSAGFSVKTVAKSSIRYVAPRLQLTIPIQRISAHEILILLKELTEWDQPNNEPLTIEDKNRLRQFLGDAYEFIGMRAEFEM